MAADISREPEPDDARLADAGVTFARTADHGMSYGFRVLKPDRAETLRKLKRVGANSDFIDLGSIAF